MIVACFLSPLTPTTYPPSTERERENFAGFETVHIPFQLKQKVSNSETVDLTLPSSVQMYEQATFSKTIEQWLSNFENENKFAMSLTEERFNQVYAHLSELYTN